MCELVKAETNNQSLIIVSLFCFYGSPDQSFYIESKTNDKKIFKFNSKEIRTTNLFAQSFW